MNSVNPPTRPSREHPHIGVLFIRARRLLDDEIMAALKAAGYEDLRISHESVFSYMPERGTRLTELARRARITKQSMGELVRDLERLGYVERAPDPADGRAQIIRYTKKGRRADAIGVETVVEFERRWANAAGAAEIKNLRATLEKMTRRPESSAG